MDDLISRQAAIDALMEQFKRNTPIAIRAKLTVEGLPSAQPYTDEEIQKMQDLEQAELDKAFELGKQAAQEDLQPTCNQLATDCISRQDVLNWLNDEWDGMVLSVFDGIRNLPSAQPEPLTEEEMRLLKKLRSFHSGSYAKLLDKLVASAQPEPQWIPCSERLPSEGENVLLCDTRFGNVAIGKLIRYNTSCCWEVDHWDCDIEDWQAWMPLPEPWRGEEYGET